MPSEVIGEVVEVPRPVAILLEFAYFVLLAVGILAPLFTIGYLLWQCIENWHSTSSSSLPAQANSDTNIYGDEESGEGCTPLEFEDDTDEEYMRRPY